MSECPSSELMWQYLEDRLPDLQRELLVSHVEGCSSCEAKLRNLAQFLSSRLAGLLRQETDAASPQASPSPRSEAPLPQVPGYEVLDEVGRGGMGIVYRARQKSLGRLVALKIVRAGTSADAEDRGRFLREAEAVARLQHPNVVQVHEAGEHGGLPFLVLEFCPAGSLQEQLRGTPLPPPDAARLVESLAEAVQAAHDKGVIHRDLKPANVLLAEDSTPKVTDFGLARLTDAGRQTVSGAIVGTPSYMAPEQAGGNSKEVGPQADVYSLGAILYECLTGRPPFVGANVHETLWQVLHREPVPPHQLAPAVPRDLETVCQKCLTKEPQGRYASAAELAADLQRFRRGEPVKARRLGPIARAVRWARRRPALAGSLLLGVLGTTGGLIRADLARRDALVAWATEEEKRIEAENAWQAEQQQREQAQKKEAEANAVITFFENKVFAAGRPVGQVGGLGHDVTLRAAVDSALPALATGFEEQPLVEARLRMTLGTTYFLLDNHKAAADQFERARSHYSRQLGPEHPDTLRSQCELGQALIGMGKDDFAGLKLLKETLAVQRRVLPPDHPDILKSIDVLIDFSTFDRTHDAENVKLSEEALALRQKKLGPEHPETLKSMHRLAVSYINGRSSPRARQLSEQLSKDALAAQRRILSPDHPDLLEGMSSLAVVYDLLGRRVDAFKLNEQLLSRLRQVLPPDHTFTVNTMNNLARNHGAMGQRREAAKLYEETLAARKRTNPPDHPNTLHTLAQLAQCYIGLGRFNDAQKLSEEELAGHRRTHPPGHPLFHRTVDSMARLAMCLASQGRSSAALIPVIDEFVTEATRLPDDVELARGLSGLISVRFSHFRASNDPAGCRATAAMWEQLGGTGPVNLYRAASMRAAASGLYRKANQPSEADADADRAMDWLNKAVAAKFSDLPLMAKNRDLDSLRERPDFQELMAPLLKQAEDRVASQRRSARPEAQATLAALDRLATTYSDLNRHADALPLLEEVLAARRRINPPSLFALLGALHKVGVCQNALGRPADALKVFEEELALHRKVPEPSLLGRMRMLECLVALVDVLVKQNRGAEAVPLIDEFMAGAVGKSDQLQSTKLLTQLMHSRLRHFEQKGDPAACRATAEMWERFEFPDPLGLYHAATSRSAAAGQYLRANQPQEATADADRAMDWLKKAVAAGFRDRSLLEKDVDFTILRKRSDFQALLASLPASGGAPALDLDPVP